MCTMLLLLLAVFALTRAAVRSPTFHHYDAFVREGDLNIGFLTRVKDDCGDVSADLKDALDGEQVAIAVDRINNSTTLLPNISLGLVVLDTCREHLQALARTVYLLPEDGQPPYPTARDYPSGVRMRLPGEGPERRPRHYSVVGVVGVSRSDQAVNVAALLGAFHIPLISHHATSDELSDKARFPYFMRVVPPDRFTAEALVDIARHFKWTYVSLLYSEGSYGEYSAKELERLIRASSPAMCIAFSHRISSTADQAEYTWVAEKLERFRKARVVFMVSNKSQQRGVFSALKRRGLNHAFLFLAGDVFERRAGEYGEGALYVGHQSLPIPGYQQYISRITPWTDPGNAWLPPAWQQHFNCSWDTSPAGFPSCYNFSLEQETSGRRYWSSSRIYDAVYVYAHALHRLIKNECPEQFSRPNKTDLRACAAGPRLLPYLHEVEFQGVTTWIKFDRQGDMLGWYNLRHYRLDADGEFRSRTVGTWSKLTETLTLNYSQLDWHPLKEREVFATEEVAPGELYVPESVCSKPCGPRQYRVMQELPCCWQCRYCRPNERVLHNHSACELCAPYTWPSPRDPHTCLPIPPSYLRPADSISLGLVSLGTVGVLGTLGTGAAMFRHRHHRLIRSTSKELSLVILAGTLLASFDVLVFVTKPSAGTCLLRMLGFHYGVNLLYSPLMMKTIRIYRIFAAGRRSVRRPRLVSSSSQIVLTAAVVLLQTGVIVVVQILAPTTVGLRQTIRTSQYVELECRQPLGALLLPLGLNLALVLVCAVLGYLTRKLPENFNESWYIFVSVCTTLFAWMVILPTYFTAFYVYQQMALLAFCLVLNAYITMGCLFLPKLYAIVCVDEARLQVQSLASTSKVHSLTPSTNVSHITVGAQRAGPGAGVAQDTPSI